ncbi:hypothetical protein WJX79_008625 [Trebouxia sp. C0005]
MMHNPGDAFLNSLGAEAGKKVTDFNAQNHANTVWAFATLGHNPGDHVLRVMARDAEGKVMAAEALRKLETFTPQALSNTVWGFSKLEVVHERLLDAVAAIALRKLQAFNGQNIANTVWAYANLGYDPGALMDAVAQCSEYRMQEFSPQNISNILWAYAKLGKLHPELMEAAALHSRALMTTFQPQSIANMIWAYATLAHSPLSDFLTLLCGHALHELPNFSPQNISNTIWALATLKHTNRALMQAVEVEVTARLGIPEEAIKFSRQHLANSLWALATLELLPSGRLLAAVAEAMKERASDCNPQEISNTVWAFAKLGFYSEGMMDRFASEAEGRIQEFSQQNLANMAWAFGKLTHDAPSLLDAIGLKATTIVKDLSLQHITNILWTYASFLHDVPEMLPAFTSQVLERSHKEQFNAQQLSNLLWSLCILQSCDGVMWRRIMQQFTSLGMAPDNLPEEALTQIYQAYLLMKTDQEGVELPLGEGLLEHAQQVWIESCKNIRVSGLHRDVARVLTSMGLSHTIEQLTDDSLFSVDIALAGEKVAVEVDGPHHFTANGQRPLGEMRARHRLLEVRGWSVLSVPYFLWAKQADDTAHVLFLRQVDSKPATQHTVAIKEGNDCEPLQHESCGPTAVDKLKNSHSNSVTAPLGQVSGGAKRSASDTELVSHQLSPGSKSAPETTPLSWTQGVTQTQIKGEQLLEALAQQTHSVKCTAQIDRAHDVGQAQIPWNGVKAEHWGTPPQSSGVQSQGSAGQVVAPGIRMLHPGLSPALSPGNLSSLESAISVSAVQGAVPRSQPAVPSLKLPESVVNQPPSAGDISFVAAAKAAPIVVKNEAQHEAKRDASNRDVAVNTDMAAVGPASSFNSLNLSALLDRRKQELLELAKGSGENEAAVGPETTSTCSAASPALPMPSKSTDAVPVVENWKTDLKAEVATVTQPSVQTIGKPA